MNLLYIILFCIFIYLLYNNTYDNFENTQQTSNNYPSIININYTQTPTDYSLIINNILNYFKTSNDINYTTYSKLLNDNNNTNEKLISLHTFRRLDNYGQDITLDIIKSYY